MSYTVTNPQSQSPVTVDTPLQLNTITTLTDVNGQQFQTYQPIGYASSVTQLMAVKATLDAQSAEIQSQIDELNAYIAAQNQTNQ